MADFQFGIESDALVCLVPMTPQLGSSMKIYFLGPVPSHLGTWHRVISNHSHVF